MSALTVIFLSAHAFANDCTHYAPAAAYSECLYINIVPKFILNMCPAMQIQKEYFKLSNCRKE